MSDEDKRKAQLKQEAQEAREGGNNMQASIRELESLMDEDGHIGERPEEPEPNEGDFTELLEEMGAQTGGDDEYTEPFGEDEADDSEDDGPARLDLTDDATLDALVTVTVQGEEIDVPLREALNGHMRHSAFTKKTTELAEQRREVEALRDSHAQMIEIYLAGDNLTPGQRQALQANYKAIQAEQARDAEAAYKKHAKAEARKLAEAFGWDKAEPETIKQEQAELRAAAESYGFTPDEVSTADSRAVLLLRDAMRYRQMTEKGAEVRSKAKKAPVLKPGSTSGREGSEAKARKKKWKRLERTGSIQDAAAVFEDFV